MELWDPVAIELKAMLDNPDAFKKASDLLDPVFRDKDGERLIKAFLAAQTSREMSFFLKDILTDKQIDHCKKKMCAAGMLINGMSYEFIEEATGLTPRIIARISKKLKEFDGGYNTVLSRLYPSIFS
ncbi:MAG: Trp family transcriptional regulator [Candidatus Taylorbacteria bacterium]|nr:Trp family transcriptional regulator [Candidatus Taylorbacteria bacterium]